MPRGEQNATVTKHKDPRLVRIDATRLKVSNPQGVDATLFANEQVPIESTAVDELVGVVALRETVERLAKNDPQFFEAPPELKKVAVTPDFHKGAGIPIGTVMATRGFVVPQAIGNDINCGMRLHVTTLPAERVLAGLDDLEGRTRRLYFEGGRNIPMTRVQREAMLREGLAGLLSEAPAAKAEGLWEAVREFSPERDLEKVHEGGVFPAGRVVRQDDFLGPAEGATRDGQIGSIGGGNHFVEVQRVARIIDGPTAHAWGLREGRVTVMVHSGSLSIGHRAGSHVRDVMREIYPSNLRHPDNGIFLLPRGERHRAALDLFWDAMSNAANFAFANRLFLALMALRTLREACGGFDTSILYDAHTTWSGGRTWEGRKFSCTARAPARRAGSTRWVGRRSSITGSRSWYPGRWGRRVSCWPGAATRTRCGAPATGRAGRYRGARRCWGTKRRSVRS